MQARTHWYRALDTIWTLRWPGPAEASLLSPVFSHLELRGRGRADVALAVERDGPGYLIRRDGVMVASCRDLESLTPLVDEQVRRIILEGCDPFLQFHSAALARRSECLLLPGGPGSGKSALAAALMGAGLDYLSDEVTVLEPSCTVRTAPLSLSIECGDLGPLAPRYPELAQGPAHRREDGRLVRYLTPSENVLAPAGHHDVRWMVFPRQCPGASTRLQRISRVDALGRIMDECLPMPDVFDISHVTTLVKWMGSIACFELQRLPLEDQRSLDEAVALVTSLVGAPERAATTADAPVR